MPRTTIKDCLARVNNALFSFACLAKDQIVSLRASFSWTQTVST
jgi:hypothetical protein